MKNWKVRGTDGPCSDQGRLKGNRRIEREIVKKTKIKKNRGKQGRGRETSEDRELGGKVKHSKASVVSHQK